ncbi:VOC family protein [Peterkaempfera bronchialis]|uniref:Lactoylglutathione lyase n=1 Tax=Peterkaempfera bronchialis TaxID=2126346 RepID=A0A345T4Y9_9ACTN|nr:VOC family protein [Peterkaempfera bronchialis]AXI81044.1 lactoylglutathione lyase [Peterkaempfera bronchialis]
MSAPAPLPHAHGILHINLNAAAAEPEHAFYRDLLGLNLRMRSHEPKGDATPMGIDGITDSETLFLYDARGPRVAGALEIVQWNEPGPVARALPAAPWHLGIAAVGYRVPWAPEELRRRAGGAVLGEAPLPVAGRANQGALRVQDPVGVPVELVPDADGESPALSHLRINTADLERALAWYRVLGFTVADGPTRRDLPAGTLGAAGPVAVTTAAVALSEDPTFTLELTQWHTPEAVGPVPDRANTQGLFRIALACEDVNAAHAELSRDPAFGCGDPVWIPLPGTPLGGLTVMFLRDPDGVVVELVARPRSALAARG